MNWTNGLTGLGIIVSSLIAVGGWVFAREKDREFEKFKLRLVKRMEITNALADHIMKLFNHEPNGAEWNRLSILIQVYGSSDEQRLLQAIGQTQNEDERVQTEALQALQRQVLESVRKDLGYTGNKAGSER